MKKSEFQQIKNKTVEELGKDLNNNREKLRILKFDLAAGKVKNANEIREVKKTIAKIQTLLNNQK